MGHPRVPVQLGRVAGAHALRGEIRVRYFGDGPEHLLHAERLALEGHGDGTGPRHYEVERSGPGRPGEVRIKLEGIEDRDAAEALRGCLVSGDSDLLEPLPEGEHYWYELVGCRVETGDGRTVGVVREIWETGAHDVLVVERDAGGSCLVPTAREILTEVDVAGRRLVVADLEGLLDPA